MASGLFLKSSSLVTRPMATRASLPGVWGYSVRPFSTRSSDSCRIVEAAWMGCKEKVDMYTRASVPGLWRYSVRPFSRRPFSDRDWSRIEKAAFNGDKENVEKLLKTESFCKYSIFKAGMLAAENGDKEIVEILLRNESIREWQRECGQTTEDAAKKGHKELVKILLKIGPYIRVDGRDRAIVEAAHAGRKEIVEFLLMGGSISKEWHQEAIKEALRAGHKEIAEHLINIGRIISARYRDMSRIEKAAWMGRKEEVEMLLRTERLDDSTYYHVVTLAAERGHKEIIEILLKNSRLDQWTHNGAVDAAIDGGHTEVLEILLKHRSLANFRLEKKVEDAAGNGRKEIVQILLKKGLISNMALHSAMVRASRAGQEEIVEILSKSRWFSLDLKVAIKIAAISTVSSPFFIDVVTHVLGFSLVFALMDYCNSRGIIIIPVTRGRR